MLKLFFFPYITIISISLAFLASMFHLSYFYDELTEIDIYRMLVIVSVYIILSLFSNRVKFNRIGIGKAINGYRVYLFLGLGIFFLEFLIFGIPLFSGGREGARVIPVLHVLAYSLLIFSVLLSALYATKKQSLVVMSMVFLIAFLTLSRQLIMVCCIIYLLSYIYNAKLSFSMWLKVIVFLSLLMILFGIIGEYRQKLASDYVEDYIILVGGANEVGRKLGNVLYWGWLYIASPIYNFIVNLNSFEVYGEACNLEIIAGDCNGNYLMATLIPDTISKNIGVALFQIDLKMAHLTVGTAFAPSARILGLPGVVIQILLQFLFFILGHKMTPYKYKDAFIIYYSSLSIFIIFNNLYIRAEFFFVFVLLFLLRFRFFSAKNL